MNALRDLARPLATAALLAGIVIGGALALVVVDQVGVTESARATVAVDEASLREGPGYDYGQVIVLTRASKVTVVGKNNASTWLAIRNPGNTGGPPAWVVATDIDLGDVDKAELAVLPAPAAPTEPAAAGPSPPPDGSTPKPGTTQPAGNTSDVNRARAPVLPACSTAVDLPSPCVSQVEVIGVATPGQPFTVKVTASNLGADSELGAVSVSLPDGATAELDANDRQGAYLYAPGQPIGRCGDYQPGRCVAGTTSSVPANYFLAEKVVGPWRNGVEQTFLVVIRPRAGQDTVNVLVRFALRGPAGEILNYPADSPTLDTQQNFPAYAHPVRLGLLSGQEEGVRADVETAARTRAEANVAFYRDLDIIPISRITTGEAFTIYETELARLQQIGAYIESRQVLFAVDAVNLIDANNAVISAYETWDNVDHRSVTNEITGSRRARVRITYTMVREQGAWLIANMQQETLSQEPLPSVP